MENHLKNFYRRHGKGCRGSHVVGLMSYEPDERRKGWKRCDCPISISGVVAGKFIRKATGATTWEAASAVVDNWGDLTPTPTPQAPLPAVDDDAPITVERAAAEFKKSHERSAYSTRRQYGYMMKRVLAYSEQAGYRFIKQWRVSDIRNFRNGWGVSALTANKYMATLKAFFEFLVQNEWLEKNRPEGSSRHATGKRTKRLSAFRFQTRN